jgi:hypothetical protein
MIIKLNSDKPFPSQTAIRVHSNNQVYVMRKLRRLGVRLVPSLRRAIGLACEEGVGTRTEPEHIISV